MSLENNKKKIIALATHGAFLSSIEEKKKPQIVIVGAVSDVTPAHILKYIEKLKETHDIILVDSIDQAKEKTGKDIDISKMKTVNAEDFNPEAHKAMFKKNPLAEEPMKITNPYKDLEPLPELKPHLMKEHNPWPSPKGKNGKRKW